MEGPNRIQFERPAEVSMYTGNGATSAEKRPKKTTIEFFLPTTPPVSKEIILPFNNVPRINNIHEGNNGFCCWCFDKFKRRAPHKCDKIIKTNVPFPKKTPNEKLERVLEYHYRSKKELGDRIRFVNNLLAREDSTISCEGTWIYLSRFKTFLTGMMILGPLPNCPAEITVFPGDTDTLINFVKLRYFLKLSLKSSVINLKLDKWPYPERHAVSESMRNMFSEIDEGIKDFLKSSGINPKTYRIVLDDNKFEIFNSNFTDSQARQVDFEVNRFVAEWTMTPLFLENLREHVRSITPDWETREYDVAPEVVPQPQPVEERVAANEEEVLLKILMEPNNVEEEEGESSETTNVEVKKELKDLEKWRASIRENQQQLGESSSSIKWESQENEFEDLDPEENDEDDDIEKYMFGELNNEDADGESSETTEFQVNTDPERDAYMTLMDCIEEAEKKRLKGVMEKSEETKNSKKENKEMDKPEQENNELAQDGHKNIEETMEEQELDTAKIERAEKEEKVFENLDPEEQEQNANKTEQVGKTFSSTPEDNDTPEEFQQLEEQKEIFSELPEDNLEKEEEDTAKIEKNAEGVENEFKHSNSEEQERNTNKTEKVKTTFFSTPAENDTTEEDQKLDEKKEEMSEMAQDADDKKNFVKKEEDTEKLEEKAEEVQKFENLDTEQQEEDEEDPEKGQKLDETKEEMSEMTQDAEVAENIEKEEEDTAKVEKNAAEVQEFANFDTEKQEENFEKDKQIMKNSISSTPDEMNTPEDQKLDDKEENIFELSQDGDIKESIQEQRNEKVKADQSVSLENVENVSSTESMRNSMETYDSLQSSNESSASQYGSSNEGFSLQSGTQQDETQYVATVETALPFYYMDSEGELVEFKSDNATAPNASIFF